MQLGGESYYLDVGYGGVENGEGWGHYEEGGGGVNRREAKRGVTGESRLLVSWRVSIGRYPLVLKGAFPLLFLHEVVREAHGRWHTVRLRVIEKSDDILAPIGDSRNEDEPFAHGDNRCYHPCHCFFNILCTAVRQEQVARGYLSVVE